jgi:putative ABC transport system ATP-binding protein
MNQVVSLSNASKSYSGRHYSVNALRGVDLSIGRAEVVVLTGPSGSGKSTLLNIIGGIERLNEGQVAYQFGADARCDGLDETLRLKYVGFIFQDFGLLPLLSAIDNVAFPLRLAKVAAAERRARAMAMLERVGLVPIADKSVGLLSGGERQRVAIARALVNGPYLVLADEPTANLDQANVGRVLDLLREARDRDGATVVMVSHDPRCVSIADRHFELKDGLLVGKVLQ